MLFDLPCAPSRSVAWLPNATMADRLGWWQLELRDSTVPLASSSPATVLSDFLFLTGCWIFIGWMRGSVALSHNLENDFSASPTDPSSISVHLFPGPLFVPWESKWVIFSGTLPQRVDVRCQSSVIGFCSLLYTHNKQTSRLTLIPKTNTHTQRKNKQAHTQQKDQASTNKRTTHHNKKKHTEKTSKEAQTHTPTLPPFVEEFWSDRPLTDLLLVQRVSM